jgi:hypothetical protein
MYWAIAACRGLLTLVTGRQLYTVARSLRKADRGRYPGVALWRSVAAFPK